MNSEEVREWAERYDEDYVEELHQTEQRIRGELQQHPRVTKDQLKQIVEWKLDNQPGRANTNIERFEQVPDQFIRRVSEAALHIDDPEIQLKTLSSIPGIGYATATVILTFNDPESYAVGDRYMVDLLLEEDRQMRVTDYPKILERLQEMNPGDFALRTVEKAYYQSYRVKHGIT